MDFSPLDFVASTVCRGQRAVGAGRVSLEKASVWVKRFFSVSAFEMKAGYMVLLQSPQL